MSQTWTLLFLHGSDWTDVLVEEVGLSQAEAERSLPAIVDKLLSRAAEPAPLSPADVADVAGPCGLDRGRTRRALQLLARDVVRSLELLPVHAPTEPRRRAAGRPRAAPPSKTSDPRRTDTMANQPIQEIEGIGPAYAEKLAQASITNTNTLLAACGTPQGRKAIASRTGINERLLLTWTNMADLFRIKGVGSEYAELLEAAGVDTVKELKSRNAQNLHAKLKEVNGAKGLTRRDPSLAEVEGWIAHAAELPAAIRY